MSQDPFHRDADHSPAALDGSSSPPPRRRRLWLRVLLVLFGGGFLTLLICCGAGAYLVQNYGAFIFDPVRKELNQMAEVQQQIGEIESLNMDFFGTVEEGKKNPDFVIFNGQSETGPFQLSAKMDTSGELEKVFLVMPDGSRKPIDMSKRIAPPDGDEVKETAEEPAASPAESPVENDVEPEVESTEPLPATSDTEPPSASKAQEKAGVAVAH